MEPSLGSPCQMDGGRMLLGRGQGLSVTGPCHLIVGEGDPKERWAGTEPSSAPGSWSLISGVLGPQALLHWVLADFT